MTDQHLEECHGPDHVGQAGGELGRSRAWSPEIAAEFEREKSNPNRCVGNALVSESDRVRVWTIRLKPGERIGFHRHVLDYFWTAVTGGRGRQHVHDGTTVEYTYAPGETRHETYGPGQFKVHDLENLGDKEMVFMTIEFLESANKPMPLPDRRAAAGRGVTPPRSGMWVFGPSWPPPVARPIGRDRAGLPTPPGGAAAAEHSVLES